MYFFQQELAEASDIALIQYNETHPLEKTSEGVSKAMSAAVKKKRAMLSSGFTKQLAIADINLTPAFLEEVKHHWGLFFVPEMLQEKLHRVAVSNVDAEVKVGWLKFWNGNRFDKDALQFPKSPFSDSALDDWLSKATYWAQLEKKAIEELHNIVSSPLQLPTDVPTLSQYIQTWKFAAFHSIFFREFKSGKVKKHNSWDDQPNIDFAMKRVLYRYILLFLSFFLIFICYIFNFHSIFASYYFFVGISDMF